MARILECLAKGDTIKPIHIGLANGDSNVANIQGIVCTGSNINLDKVLYMPSFSCSLILMAQLTRELNCIMIFNKDLYMI